MVNPVSFMGGFNAQTSRLKNLNSLMQDMQRQFATQKKADTFSGLGFDALTVQRYRMDKSRMESYMSNIDLATTRVTLMSDSMSRAATIGREFLSNLYSQMRASDVDMDTVRRLAQQQLELLKDITNLEVDGRYLFAGSNTSIAPLADKNAANNITQTQLTDWFDGTQTTTQFLANMNSLTATQLGFDPAMTTSGSVTIRIDTHTEVDYSTVASKSGMQDVMRALAIVANLQLPSSTDAATLADFNDLLDGVVAISQRGVAAIDSANAQLSGKFNLIKSVTESHEQDIGLFETLIAKKENIDTAEVATKIQALQTQLTASYQVASYVSNLSLANFLN